MHIGELIHIRKQNIKSILIIRDNSTSKNEKNEIFKLANEYRIALQKNHRSIKYECQEDEK